MTLIRGVDTPRSVWDQDRTVIIGISSTTPIAGSPEVGVQFRAPTSGRVNIIVGGGIRDLNGLDRIFLRPQVYRGPSAAGTLIEDGAFKEFTNAPPEVNWVYGSRDFTLTGLTPGGLYYGRVTYYVSAGNDSEVAAREIIAIPLP